MENFLKQIREREFKPSNFSVYGMIENDGYIIELEGMFGKRYGAKEEESRARYDAQAASRYC